jgi:phospholipid/cholesterol/gamma-HCH transport system substrate-binding protein
MNGRVRRGAKVILAPAVVAALVAAGFAVTNSGTKDVPVTVLFADASPLIPGNVVRMDGIEVGQIKSIGLQNGQAAVRMRLKPSVLPLHTDASAKIRPVTLLGERFIDLNRGSASAPAMSEPRVISARRTSSAVDLDQVLDSLDDPTSTALAALVTTLGEGANGQGGDIDQAIRALAPAMQDTQQLGTVLDQQNAVLAQLVDRATPVAQAVAGKNGQNLDQLVDSGKQALAAVAAQRKAMNDALDRLPETLRKAQRVLSQVAGVAEAGTPTLQAVRPVTDDLPQITEELNAFADSADPALTSLPPVLNRAKALLDQAAPVVRDLRPGAAALPGASASAHRLVGDLTPALSTALDFVKYWAMSTNGRDALSNYFRAFVVTTPKSLLQIPGVGVPTGTQKPAGQKVAGGKGPIAGLPPLTGSAGTDGSSATGLDQGQENSLLNQLLGGR